MPSLVTTQQDPLEAGRIDEALVRRLLAEQFPQWRDLPIRRFHDGGNDHRMFRLGADLSVRLPRGAASVPQVAKEQTWLPRLGPLLPLEIPVVHGVGRPSSLFPAPWSVYDWKAGVPASTAEIADGEGFAADLAAFLVRLQEADARGGPPSGPHSAFRGGPLEHWDDEMQSLLLRVQGRERDLATGMWRDALSARFAGPPRWFHGDVSLNNLLVRDGRLTAVIDFGCSGAGDPACDAVFRWTALSGAMRRRFRSDHAADDATWARGRGWALWKGLIMITNKPAGQAEFARHVLDQLFADV